MSFPEKVTVYLTNTNSWTVEVTGAKDLQDAINRAIEDAPGSLCHQCSSERNDGEWDAFEVATQRDGEQVVLWGEYEERPA